MPASVGCDVMYHGFTMVMPSLVHHDKLGAEGTPFQAAHSLKEAVAWRGIRVQFEVIPIPDGRGAWRAPHFPTDTRRQEQSLTEPYPPSRTSVAGLPSDDFVPSPIGTSIKARLEALEGPLAPGGWAPQRGAGAMSGSWRFGCSPWPKQGGGISNRWMTASLSCGICPNNAGYPNAQPMHKTSYRMRNTRCDWRRCCVTPKTAEGC